MPRITEKLLKTYKHPAEGQALVWDDLVQGFGVRFTPTQASYVVQWRESDNRKPRVALEVDGRPARWPQVKPDAARDLARARLALHVGRGPGVGLRMSTALREWERHQKATAAWRPRYAQKVDRMIALYVEGIESARVDLSAHTRAAIKALGAAAVGTVRRGDVLAVSDGIKPGAADQFLAVLSSFFGWAIEREWIESNPARKRLKVTGGRRIRQRRLTDAEFLALWRTFEAEGDPALGAFQLLALTGARRREVTEMRWAELDLEAGTWTLPPERRKTGGKDLEPFVITLAPAAVAAIRRQPVLEGSPFVFWGRRDKRPFDFQHSTMDRVDAAAGVRDWRLHDLRRYMRSGLAALGVSQAVAEITLGHRSARSGLVGVYDVHDYATEKREAWLRWADHLAKLVAADARAKP